MSQRLWLALLLVSGLIFAGTTYEMLTRIGDAELWGYLPLFHLTSAWICILLILVRKAIRERRTLRIFLLGTLTAFLLAMGFPPFPLTLLLFVGFVPLLVALARSAYLPQWQRFLLLYHSVLLWNIFGTYWVANTAYAAGIFAHTVNALLMIIPLMSYRYVKLKLGDSVALVAFVSSWIAFEFLHMRWDLYWPWLTLGNGLSKTHWAIQWYEFTGVFGGSAWILVINYLFYQAYEEVFPRKKLIIIVTWLLIPMGFSLIRYSSIAGRNDSIEVVAVQPNFEPHYEKFRISQEAIFNRILNLSIPLIRPETDYLVMPETSFSRLDMDRLEDPNYFDGFTDLRATYPDLKIVTGLGAYRILQEDSEIKLPTTRSFENQGQPIYLEEYNCAVQLATDGVQEYYKALFVPGAEFFPFRKVLFFLKPIVDQLGGSIHGYRTRSKYVTFTSDKAVIAPLICYESIFGEFTNQFIKRGAQTIFVMTNDGWWDNTAGHVQHAQYAKLRAIETRRSVVRAANMGTTCFINERGDISQPSEYGFAKAIRGQMSINNEITFYVRWGDVLGRISLFIAGLLLIRSLVVKLAKAKTPPPT